jgi:pentatricopeptide repeat protein
VYNTALNASRRLLKPERAMELLQSMDRNGAAPDRTTFYSLMEACVAGGWHDKVFALVSRMKAQSEWSRGAGTG